MSLVYIIIWMVKHSTEETAARLYSITVNKKVGRQHWICWKWTLEIIENQVRKLPFSLIGDVFFLGELDHKLETPQSCESVSRTTEIFVTWKPLTVLSMQDFRWSSLSSPFCKVDYVLIKFMQYKNKVNSRLGSRKAVVARMFSKRLTTWDTCYRCLLSLGRNMRLW